MKDSKGSEISVGDTVVYASVVYGIPRVTIGAITAVEEFRARVRRTQTSNCWRPIRDGMQRVWRRDDTTGKSVERDVEPRPVWIATPGRVIVLERRGQ